MYRCGVEYMIQPIGSWFPFQSFPFCPLHAGLSIQGYLTEHSINLFHSIPDSVIFISSIHVTPPLQLTLFANPIHLSLSIFPHACIQFHSNPSLSTWSSSESLGVTRRRSKGQLRGHWRGRLCLLFDVHFLHSSSSPFQEAARKRRGKERRREGT